MRLTGGTFDLLTTMPHWPNWTGQRTREQHEDDQSDDGDNNYHDDHLWVAEALTRDYECGRNIALASYLAGPTPSVSLMGCLRNHCIGSLPKPR